MVQWTCTARRLQTWHHTSGTRRRVQAPSPLQPPGGLHPPPAPSLTQALPPHACRPPPLHSPPKTLTWSRGRWRGPPPGGLLLPQHGSCPMRWPTPGPPAVQHPGQRSKAVNRIAVNPAAMGSRGADASSWQQRARLTTLPACTGMQAPGKRAHQAAGVEGQRVQAGPQGLLQPVPAEWGMGGEVLRATWHGFPDPHVESRFMRWLAGQNLVLKYVLLGHMAVLLAMVALRERVEGRPATWSPLLPHATPGVLLLLLHRCLPASSRLREQVLHEQTWIFLLAWCLAFKMLAATGMLAISYVAKEPLWNYADAAAEAGVQVLFQIRLRHLLPLRCLSTLAAAGVYCRVQPPGTPLAWVLLPALAWNAVSILASGALQLTSRQTYIRICQLPLSHPVEVAPPSGPTAAPALAPATPTPPSAPAAAAPALALATPLGDISTLSWPG
ncbi:hypothetical protein V8C86DRAFT_1217432 [Haematococcus lacustris]